MIKNDQQETITRKKLATLRRRSERLRVKYEDDSDFEFYSEATTDNIKQLERELSFYQLARQGDTTALLRIWNERGTLTPGLGGDLTLGDFLALMRVAKGLTQSELAERIGIQQANIARYERNDYTGYSLETLGRIFAQLGLRLMIGERSIGEAA